MIGLPPITSNAPIVNVSTVKGPIETARASQGWPNMENAKKWYDWALTPEAQKLGAAANSYQNPSNMEAPIPDAAPKMADIKLIDYDFAKFGSSAERKRLLSRWDSEIGAK